VGRRGTGRESGKSAHKNSLLNSLKCRESHLNFLKKFPGLHPGSLLTRASANWSSAPRLARLQGEAKKGRKLRGKERKEREKGKVE